MNEREWKPGDVAIVKNEWNVWNVAICTLRADRHGYWWRYGVADSWSPIVAEARPLVVIDPEDREQVRELAHLIDMLHIDNVNRTTWSSLGVSNQIAAVHKALQKLANPTPPKPDEPTGLGAVVEAIHHNRFVRIDHGHQAWRRVGERDPAVTCSYADIDAVRVLSDGWSA